jgi:hypothetical protein
MVYTHALQSIILFDTLFLLFSVALGRGDVQ